MALKKSELYSSLWASCDELRGGMDASQYKDYVLVLLFVKYVSDRYAGQHYAPITIPKGASFADMVALKGKSDIGDQINKKILGPLAHANKLSDMPDFNDPNKLGSGKEMVERLTNLIAIFENPALDFSTNRADGDDLLGDAYEYLMRHFATESGKSKGQFYTPAEVSRVIAQILGIRYAKVSADTTVYDPTCGSGSLLLKIGDEARHGGKNVKVTLYGQEKDNATAGLARMNMILHDYATAEIKQGNTIANPLFLHGDALKTFDYVVANPPFSDKRWSTGLDAEHDPWQRFQHYGIPPGKQGDYAYLLHIVRSLRSTGKGACILPHGVLFRGHAEADIRKNLIRRGVIKGIIGLPPNLFYGTGIPACIVMLDKEGANARKGIFMIDASKGFIKDGNKNRLREQDIHKIVDTFTRQAELPRYSRLVPVAEIADPKNDYNLNLPRYINSTEPEDLQDIDGHLRGGIPDRDIDALDRYWQVIPGVRDVLFKPLRSGYSKPSIETSALKETIFSHPEFTAFNDLVIKLFAKWKKSNTPLLKGFAEGGHPKALIETIAENLLATFKTAPLLDAYDVYQHLMDYWAETMQDDCYLIASDGWKAAAKPQLIVDDKSKKTKAKPDLVVGKKKYLTELIPPALLIARYFASEQAAVEKLEADLAALQQQIEEMAEEHGGEEGLLAEAPNEKGKLTKASVTARLKEIKGDADAADERKALNDYLALVEQEAAAAAQLSETQKKLTEQVAAQYAKLTDDEIKTLVVDDKWLATLAAAVQGELDRVPQTLTGRIRQLAERYASPLPKLTGEVSTLAARVDGHLKKGSGMEVTPGYKQTEVGVIPEEWEVLPFKEQFNISAGGDVNPKLSSLEQDDIHRYPIYSNALTDRGLYGYCSYADHPAHSITITARGTLGVATYRDHKYTAIGRVLVLEPKRQSAGQFLAEFTNSRVKFAIESTGVPQLTAPQISGYRLVIPPYPEQLAIAEALSDVDGLLGGLDRLIAKKRDLKQAAMQQLLTGQTRLPGFHGEWEVKRLGEVATPRKGRVDPRTTGVHEFCVELEHIASGSGELLGSTSTGDQSSLKSVFRPGDVLFGKLRAYLRKYWLAARSGVCSTEIWVFAPNDRLVTTEFLFQTIKTDQFIEAASNSYGTHMPRSDWNVVKNYEFSIPSLPEQTAIAEVLSDMDTELAGLEQRREKTRALKHAMMQELLTGRTRLV